MKHLAKSVRTFIGAKNFEESRNFYKDLGFEESIISKGMSYFKIVETLGFYLQDYYVEDWINNSMMFVEVVNVEEYFLQLQNLNLQYKYKDVKLVPIRYEDWGSECFLHDPAGVLWHFGAFKK
ncbi:MAG: glyoxalase [Ferruginibacter sp.]|nr:glyoxalase [Ferruginibacter sp.]